MKFLVDAHLPHRVADLLVELGFDAIHTLDLPLGNRTPDTVINELSIQEQYIVITKDADFVNSFLLSRKPYKLLLVSTGNIRNKELEVILLANIEKIADGFTKVGYIEMDRKTIIFHA